MTVQALKQQFLVYLTHERGRSAKTIKNYNRYLERFFAFAGIKHPRDINETLVHEFRLYLERQPGAKNDTGQASMKLRTQNYHLIALRAFLTYAQNQRIETMSARQIELAAVPDASPAQLSPAELARLRSAPDTKSLAGKRDHALIELLLATALRISELCALSITDIDLVHGELTVRSLKGADRVVAVPDSARRAIDRYLSARTDLDSALFIRYGRKANDGGDLRLHARAIQRLCKKYAGQAGITRTVTPRIIRHTVALDLLQHGADIRSVQALLGHSSDTAIKVYTQSTDRSI